MRLGAQIIWVEPSLDWGLCEKGVVRVKGLSGHFGQELFKEAATVDSILDNVVSINKLDAQATLHPVSALRIELFEGILE